MLFFGKFFRTTILFIIFLEILSFFGYLFPVFNSIVFGVLVVLFVIIAWKKLDWALYILLAELFIGSKGYLFYYSFGGQKISIRIAFWFIIMLVWVVSVSYYLYKEKGERHSLFKYYFLLAKNRLNSFKSLLFSSSPPPTPSSRRGSLVFLDSGLTKYFLLFFIVLIWSLLMALIKHNQAGNIFNDFNAYLYFGLIFVFYDVIKEVKQIKELMQVLIASLVTMSLKTIALLYLFSHQFFGIKSIYKWVRTSGVGEITMLGGNFYRIFFQSHIFVVIGFVLILVFLLFGEHKITKDKIKNFSKYHKTTALLALTILFVSTLLISLSRSIGVGLFLGLIVLFVFYLIYDKFNYKNFIFYLAVISGAFSYLGYVHSGGLYLNIIMAILVVFILLTQILSVPKKRVYLFLSLIIIIYLFGYGFVNNVIKFPFPKTGVVMSLGEIMEDRATISGDAATGSRWNLLKPLASEILKFPTILTGDGFGKTVTYFSKDPRVLEKNPTGEYTTYAFEWGYLDLWLKLGLVGLVIYLILLFKIFWLGWSQLIKNKLDMEIPQNKLVLGLLLGVIVLVATHGFTPYLNHPLGIGYLMMCSVVFEVLNNKTT